MKLKTSLGIFLKKPFKYSDNYLKYSLPHFFPQYPKFVNYVYLQRHSQLKLPDGQDQ